MDFMFTSRESVTFTVCDGTVYMCLDNVTVHIPSHIYSQSKVFMDALSSVADPYVTDQFTLVAPQE
jgi:hypothetical protein